MSKPTRPKDTSATYSLFAKEAWAYMDALEAENAELQKTPNELRRVLGNERENLTRAVQLLRICRPYLNLVNNDDGRNVDAFLSEMEETHE